MRKHLELKGELFPFSQPHMDENNSAALYLTKIDSSPMSRETAAEEIELDRKMSDKGFSETEKKELDEWLFR